MSTRHSIHDRLRQLAMVLGPAAGSLVAGLPAQAAGLPVTCAGASCAGGPAVWVTQGIATAVTNAAGTQLDVNQASDRAVLNWAEFNVAAGNAVKFNQPGANALALNRIFQGDPSRIFGTITANGQIYLINQNGILFGKDSQVNVGALIASSLDIDPDAIAGGILNPSLLDLGKPAFQGDGRLFVTDANGQIVAGPDGQPLPVKVVVEEGAKIASAPGGGGSVALLGQQVENAGDVRSPSGQVILAAGQKVYLQASKSADLRGLLVEVDAGGTAWNQATGQLSSTVGNVSLVGLAVNQDGRISATTSVQTNGSIRLLARDTVNVVRGSGDPVVQTSRAGDVTLGGGSRTEVIGDAATARKTAVADQVQPASSVEVMGRQIRMRAGSAIQVPGGKVSITALPDPSQRTPAGDSPLPEDSASRIRLEAGSRIDVAGSVAEVDLSRNLVAVELRSNELRDSPAQRDGALRGKTVLVDTRVGTPLADVSGAAANLSQEVRERTAAGGTVSLNSQGDIVLAEGATIDVSGGAVNYRGGVLQTSRLVTADGQVVDIGQADKGRIYQSVSNPLVDVVYRKWGVVETRAASGIGLYQPGYSEGRDAGTVQFAARRLVVNGNLLGGVRTSGYQRTPEARPVGGRLIIGLPGGSGLDFPDYLAPSIGFTTSVVPVAVLADQPLPESWQRLELPTRYLTTGGFNRTELYSNGVISLGADVDLDLAAGSTLRLQGSLVDVAGDISTPGGEVALKAVLVNPLVVGSGARRPGVFLADEVTLDVSGRWVNDLPQVADMAPEDPLFIDAGRIDLQVTAAAGSSELALGTRTRLRADGGGWLSGDGALTAGRGGSIGVQALGPLTALATGSDLQLSGYALSQGGTLTLAANRLQVTGSGPAFAVAQRADPAEGDRPFELAAGVFQNGGFRDFRLAATGGRATDANGGSVEPLTVAAGVTVAPRVSLLTLDPGFRGVASGADLRNFSSVFLPTDDVRPAANVAFALTPNASITPEAAGDLLLAAGSVVRLDPKGRAEFSAPTRVRLDGLISAPAGEIRARLTKPGSSLERGFDANVGIFVGSSGRLDASGTTVLTPNDFGLRQGEILDGGKISLLAQRGRVELAAGSELDVSGARAELDLPAGATVAGGAVTRRTTVASRGGAIDLLAPEGLRVDGELSGAGGSGSAEGGSLALGVSRFRGFDVNDELLPTFPTGPRQIVVTDNPTGVATNGVAELDTRRVNGGFHSLTLQADDEIQFATSVQLALANRLALDAPNLRAAEGVDTVSLAGNHVAIGPRSSVSSAPAPATGGGARLRAEGGLIDLFGSVALQGFGESSLTARTDIRATGLPVSAGNSLSLPGTLNAAGRLTLTAAQVYPTTYSTYRVNVSGTDAATGLLEIVGNGSVPGRVLSAAGQLQFAADEIRQSGTVLAPLGQIGFIARDRLTLAAGSTTSTSATGQLLPFGRVVGGTSWTYEAIPGVTPDLLAPPEKRIRLDGRQVTVADGALVDLAGGGDLYAYEFLPGPGGSVDALAPGLNPNLYAILPDAGTFSPYDTQEFQGSSLRSGDSVRLGGVPGLLAAGEYALLPARYALLPGAVLVEVVPGVKDLGPGELSGLPDGTPVVAGVRTIGGTAIADSRSTGFAVRPGSYARKLAEYRDNFGNAFFAAKAAAIDQPTPPVARDAGALQVVVGDTLDLGGTLRLQADAGDPAKPEDDGRAGRVDLSAERLRIVDAVSAVATGMVEVTAAILNGFGADSILLGGTRSVLADSTEVAPTARTVEIADGLTLAGNEYLLLAEEQVSIGANAVLRSSGAATGRAGNRLVVTGSTGSALVRVARNGPVELQRQPAAAPAGDLIIGAGALLGANGSVTVDAGGVARSFGGFELGPAASLALGSNRIVLGADQATIADGLALPSSALATLSSAAGLQLLAREGVDIVSPVVLGTADRRPGRLILDTPVIRGNGAGAALAGGDLVIRNSGGALAAQPLAGSGTLALTADRLTLEAGDVALDGFAAAAITANLGVGAAGTVRLRSGADINVSTPSLGGSAGSEVEILAAGRAVQLTSPTVLPPDGTATVGAALTVEAGTISADTRLLYPAGRVRLVADGDVTLGSNARIDVAGRRLNLAGAPVNVAAGAITVVARSGAINFAPGSTVDVSAGTGTANAGAVDILAGGQVNLAGALVGTAPMSSTSPPTTGQSGAFAVTAATVVDFADLNRRLNEGGFHHRLAFETLSGDLTLDTGDVIRAGDVTVAASGGNLTVAGRIDAMAPGGGQVVLAARDNLRLVQGAAIDARSSATGTRTPSVMLSSTRGDIDLEAGSRVGLAGFAGETGGELLIRASATPQDMRLTGLGATIDGAARTILEPVRRPDPVEFVDASVTESWKLDLDAYMAVAPDSIRARLGSNADSVLVRPGLEVSTEDDLALADSWDLADWRWADQPGYLTLRAAGNLRLQGNLADGFRQTGTTLDQLTGDSWSLRVVAGADPGSALPWAARGRLLDAPDNGNLELGDGLLIRTGTGDIRLVAANDLRLAGGTTAIYTAGLAARPAVNVSSFRANWSRDGGDVSLSAGRDLAAILPAQLSSGWNVRNRVLSGRAQWATDYGRFQQGVAALAGGTLAVTAGRDILNLSATVATTSGEVPTSPGTFATWGGGQLQVAAGRDLLGGTYSVWQGDGRLVAGRTVGLGMTADLVEVGPTLSHGAGVLTVAARKDLEVGAILNPTVIPAANGGSVFFYTYQPDDALNLTAVGGRLRLSNDPDGLANILGADFVSQIEAFGVAAPTLSAVAASGDLELVKEVRLLPAAGGQVEIIAAGSVKAADRTVSLLMSDADPAGIPSPLRPGGSADLVKAVTLNADAAIHIGDEQSALLIAAEGDILGGAWQFAKHFRAIAGGDIRDLSIAGQNTNDRQVSLIQAGRDLDLNARDNPRNSSGNRIELGGPGRLQILAGRNVSLGFSRGITTIGDTANPQLPSGGAALSVWAGLGGQPRYATFNTRYWEQKYSDEFQQYLDGEEGSPGLLEFVAGVTGRTDLNADNVWSVYSALEDPQQKDYLRTLAPDQQVSFQSFVELVDSVVTYTNRIAQRSDLAPTTAVPEYLALDTEQQRPMIQEFFYRELRDSGRLANLPQGDFGFERGQTAVSTLFPEGQAFAGDLSLLFSRLYTLAGGDVSLLLPSGLLNVGLSQPPSNLPVTKRPSDLGIVTQGSGRVQIFADGDILVNQSRIFTLGGGDIVIWSSSGDIDAGRGSKSAISAPPPVIRVDANGQVEVEFSDAIAGSGIRGILTSDDLEPGDVDLIAPTGQVNAGDAGIGSAGNLNIAAPQVVGLDNIQVGGISTGVPTDSGIASSLTGVSGLSSSAAKSAEDSAEASAGPDAAGSLADAALGWLDIFVEGFGEEEEEEEGEE